MKKLILVIGLILILGLCGQAWATNYYIDTDSAGGDGTTTELTGAQAAFATIAAAQAALTGDQSDNFLLFNRGDTWREQFTVGANGTSGHQFTIGAYGEGAAPIINAADTLTTWSASGSSASSGSEEIDDDFDDGCDGWTVNGDALCQNSRVEITVAGAADRITKVLTERTEYWSSTDFYLVSGYTWGVGQYIESIIGIWDASIGLGSVVDVKESGGTLYFQSRYNNDAGAQTSLSSVSVSADTAYNIVVHYKAATTVDTNDGIVQAWANDVEIINLTNVDNNTIKVDLIKLGSTFTDITSATIYIDNAKVGTTGNGPNGGAGYEKAGITTEPIGVVYDGTVLTANDGATIGVALNEWDWAGDVLYVNVGEDPDIGVLEAGQRNSCIVIATKDYVTVDGITVKYSNSGSDGSVHIEGACNDVIINDVTAVGLGTGKGISFDDVAAADPTDCYVRSCTISGYYDGIRLYDGQSITIGGAAGYANTVSGNYRGMRITDGGDGTENVISYNICHTNSPAEGITVIDTSYVIVAHNITHSNGGCGILSQANNVIIEYNKVYNNGINPDAPQSDSGISVYDGADNNSQGQNNIVRFNLVYDTQTKRTEEPMQDGNGIILDYGGGNEVYGNICYGNDGSGLRVLNEGGNVLYSNTLYNNGQNRSANHTADHLAEIDMVGDGSDTGNIFKNNIVYATQFYCVAADPGPAATFDSNIYYKAAGDLFLLDATGYDTSEFGDWKTAISGDANSSISDPLFTNAAGGDFTLQAGSPCCKAGTYIEDISLEDESGATEMRGSFVDGQAWFHDAGGLVAAYAGTGNRLIVDDGTGVQAVGYIGEAGTGEVLGANLFDQEGGSGGTGDKGGFTLADLRLAELSSGSLTVGTMYEISAQDGENFTLDGAPDNDVGTTFIATGTNVTLDADDKVYPVDIYWLPYGANTIEIDDGALHTTWVDTAEGASNVLRGSRDLSIDPTITKMYKLIGEAKVGAGDSVVIEIRHASPLWGTSDSVTITSTEFLAFELYFTYSKATDTIRFDNMAAGEEIWLDNLKLYEVTEPNANAVHIYKEAALTNEGWPSIDAGINYNAGASWDFDVYPKAGAYTTKPSWVCPDITDCDYWIENYLTIGVYPCPFGAAGM